MRLPSFLLPTYLLSPCFSSFAFSPFTSPLNPFTYPTPLHTHFISPSLHPSPSLSSLFHHLSLVMMEEWVKVHTNKRVQHESSTGIDGDYFYFKGGSTGIIKILEPMNPQLNYYEYLIVSRGEKAGIGIGVCMPLRGTPLHYLRALGLGLGPCACMHGHCCK